MLAEPTLRPDISIIIPLYNAEAYIQETLRSVLSSKGVSLEVLVIDDGSKDRGAERVLEMNRSEVKLIRMPLNSGASAARNEGIRQARGRYLLFMDADDLIAPDKLRLQLNVLEEHPGDLCFGNTVYFFDGENPEEKKPEAENVFYYSSDSPVDFMLHLYGVNGPGGMIPVHAWLCPTKIIQQAGFWCEYLSLDDDGEYFCRVMLQAKKIHYLPEALGYYRKFSNRVSLSRSTNKKALESAILAIDLKRASLEKNMDTSDPRFGRVLGRLYMEAAIATWPVFPDLTRRCTEGAKSVGDTSYIPYLGNPILEKLRPIFGWKFLSLISYYKNKYF